MAKGSREPAPSAIGLRTLVFGLIALASLLRGGIPLRAQTADTNRIAVDAVSDSSDVRLGTELRSIQLGVFVGAGLNAGLSCDLDLLRLRSYPELGIGLRISAESASSLVLVDYSYADYHANLLARFTLGGPWVRLDLYGGYAFVLRSDAGWDLPRRTRGFNMLKLGGEVRILFIRNTFGLIIGYGVAGNEPLGGNPRKFEMGGMGFVVSWGP
jgi:hypothetical protein